MKTVVIGDLHGRSTWKLITHIEQPDRIIFIGDYFDSFDIKGDDQLNNFLDILQYKKTASCEVILLIGNHDYHYFPEIGNVGTSGYQTLLAPSFKYVVGDNRDHLQMAYQMDEYLFTHAGVSSDFMDSVYGKNGWKTENIVSDLNEMFKYKPMTFDFGVACDSSRLLDPTGDNLNQSPIWIRPKSLMRANYNTLRKQVIQVVGHTQVRVVDSKGTSTGHRYWFIDCLGTSGEYLVIENNKPVVKCVWK